MRVVLIKDEDWTLLMEIIEENLNEMACIMLQQVIEAGPGRNKGETLKYATEVVDESRKKLPGQQWKETQRQQNNIGNAEQTKSWTKARGLTSCSPTRLKRSGQNKHKYRSETTCSESTRRKEEREKEKRQGAAAGRAVLVEMSPVKMLSCKTGAALVTETRSSESGREPDANREEATWVSGKQNTRWKLGRRKRNNQCG